MALTKLIALLLVLATITLAQDCRVSLSSAQRSAWSSDAGDFTLYDVSVINSGDVPVSDVVMTTSSTFESAWEIKLEGGQYSLPEWRHSIAVEPGTAHEFGYIIAGTAPAQWEIVSCNNAAPAPAPNDAPAPAPSDAPAPAPETPDAPAPAPETPDAPAPAPETPDAPAPAPETPDAPAPAPETPDAPEPAPETPDAPEPAPETPDAPAPETPDAPADAESEAPAEDADTPTEDTDAPTEDTDAPAEDADTPAPAPETTPTDAPEEAAPESLPTLELTPATEEEETLLKASSSSKGKGKGKHTSKPKVPTKKPSSPSTKAPSSPSTKAPSSPSTPNTNTKAPSSPSTKPVSPSTAPGSTCGTGKWWKPAPGTTWQWQLTGTIDQTKDVQMYDIDLFDASASLISSLHGKGKIVVCYFSTQYENWRPDAKDFTSDVLGSALDGWPGENWVNIKSAKLREIMRKRLVLAQSKGCDGVEPDNVDGYSNGNGLGLTAADQLDFNKYLASTAHSLGLSIGLKNDLDQAKALEPYFDWALNEQCNQYGECSMLDVFIKAGKAVFNAEYSGKADTVCKAMVGKQFSSIIKKLSLDASITAQCCTYAANGCAKVASACGGSTSAVLAETEAQQLSYAADAYQMVDSSAVTLSHSAIIFVLATLALALLF